MNIEITPEITALVDQIADQYRKRLKDVRASGKLEDFTTDIEITDTKFKVIFNLEDYWRWVEYGRGPGKMPPISAIENWIKIKPVIPDSRTGKVPDTRQLAFLIARKIATYGTPSHYPLHLTQTSYETDNIISAIKQEISKQVYKYITSDETSD
jgi:hypothetical protein